MATEKSVVLLMGEGISNVDFKTPDEAGRLTVEAGIAKYRSGRARALVITAGKVNSDAPSIGRSMHEYLQDLAPEIPDQEIMFTDPQSRTNTRAELYAFLQQARQQHWHEVEIICSGLHLQRVKRNVQRIFAPPLPRVKTEAFDTVLSKDPFRVEYHERLGRYYGSQEYREACSVEVGKDLVDSICPQIFDLTRGVFNLSEALFRAVRWRNRLQNQVEDCPQPQMLVNSEPNVQNP